MALVQLYLHLAAELSSGILVTFWPKDNAEDRLFWGSRPKRVEVVWVVGCGVVV